MKTEHIILLAVGVLSLDLIIAQQYKKPKILIYDKLPFNYNAQTIPPFGIIIQGEDADNEMLLKHELVHWEQYRKQGLLIYYFKYFAQILTYGYDKMPMEIEARKKAGEKSECIENYTECVKNGNASTVFDPDFRVANFE